MDKLLCLILVALALDLSYAEPSCSVTDGFKFRRVFCKNFKSSDDFGQYVVRGESQKETWFKLKDSHIDRFPARAFADLNAVKVILYNVTVDSFSQVDPNPFEGLENTLRRVVFHTETTFPESWSILGGLHKLEELCVDDYRNLRLTSDFNNLPKGLKTLYVTHSKLTEVDSDWLTSLTNLEALVFRRTNLTTFHRSWLPSPAPKFTTLDFTDNKLTAFPAGLGDQLPNLSYVNVQKNQVTTFEEKDFATLDQHKLIVLFKENPVHCDCKLWFLLGYTHKWHYPLCASPPSLANKPFLWHTEAELPCTTASVN